MIIIKYLDADFVVNEIRRSILNKNQLPLPPSIETEEELEELLSRPNAETIGMMSKIKGDIIILGVSGKIGMTLARLVKRTVEEAGVNKSVIGVSRFSSPEAKETLTKIGVETISCDLLEEESVDKLPDVPNVIYMVGRKFGTETDKSVTWVINTHLPEIVAKKFRKSRMVVFSTGNVYPLVSVKSGGASESSSLEPIGEYAQSCLGRERIFEYFCRKFGSKALFLRLSYAIDLRYGVLLDVAQKVFNSAPIDLRTGYVNVIWQGDVNNIALQALTLCDNPPAILNVTGPETVSIRWLAGRFGSMFNKEPIFENEEMETAFLDNASRCHSIFGYPRVTLDHMIRWVAHWFLIGGATLDKPTHFEVRDGRY
jgi:nucleoside-diphosphate-sugar epimerase